MSKKSKKDTKEQVDPGLIKKLDDYEHLIRQRGMAKEDALSTMIGQTMEKLESAGRNMEWLMDHLPSANELPLNWKIVNANWAVGCVEYARQNSSERIDLFIIASVSILDDGCGWMHLEVSKPLDYPTYEDLLVTRQVLAPKSKFVYSMLPDAPQIAIEQHAPIKIVNIYANLAQLSREKMEHTGISA